MPGQQNLHVDLGFLDVDRRWHRIAHRLDARLSWSPAQPDCDLGAARNVLLQLVDVVGDPAPRLVLAEVVREDRLRWAVT